MYPKIDRIRRYRIIRSTFVRRYVLCRPHGTRSTCRAVDLFLYKDRYSIHSTCRATTTVHYNVVRVVICYDTVGLLEYLLSKVRKYFRTFESTFVLYFESTEVRKYFRTKVRKYESTKVRKYESTTFRR